MKVEEVAQEFGGVASSDDPGAADESTSARVEEQPREEQPREDVERLYEVEDSPSSIWEVLQRTPSKSVREADATELFDPEHGGRDRFALVVEEVLGSEGIPLWLHLVVATIEVSIEQAREQSDQESEVEEVVPA